MIIPLEQMNQNGRNVASKIENRSHVSVLPSVGWILHYWKQVFGIVGLIGQIRTLMNAYVQQTGSAMHSYSEHLEEHEEEILWSNYLPKTFNLLMLKNSFQKCLSGTMILLIEYRYIYTWNTSECIQRYRLTILFSEHSKMHQNIFESSWNAFLQIL